MYSSYSILTTAARRLRSQPTATHLAFKLSATAQVIVVCPRFPPPVPFDAETAPYDPNDEAAVEAFAAQAKVARRRGPGRAPLKVPTTIRFDADVLAALKATGPGWQTRVNAAMREWVRSHPAG